MNGWEFFWKLYNKIEEKHNGKPPARILVLLAIAIILCVVGTGVYHILNSNYYTQRWQIPVWNYQEESGCDVIESDIELKAGDVVITPQIEVRYDEKVVFIIDILYYYEENSSTLVVDEKGETKRFVLPVKDYQREKADALFQMIQENVIQGVCEKRAEKEEYLEFEAVKVVEIHAQNIRADEAETQYICVTDVEEDDINANEAAMRKTTFNINLDDYVVGASKDDNAEVMQVISMCVEKILSLE